MLRISSLRIPLLATAISAALGCAGPLAKSAHAETAAIAPPPLTTAQPYSSLNELEKDYRQATGLLFAQDDGGSLRMLCTVTAFERIGKVHRFVTAAHCLAEDDTSHDRVRVAPNDFFITFDDRDNKNFIAVKVLRAGYQHRGDDFAVLEVTLDQDVPIMPLAPNDPSLGEGVCNFASPLGLGKQLFRGHVSMERLERPLIEGEINWKGAALLQMSSGPGSSGSAIVSTHQKAIIAFLVGHIGARGSTPNIVAIPVSKFKKFNEEVAAGTYRWYKNEPASATRTEDKGKMIQRIYNRIHVQGISYQIPTEPIVLSPAVSP